MEQILPIKIKHASDQSLLNSYSFDQMEMAYEQMRQYESMGIAAILDIPGVVTTLAHQLKTNVSSKTLETELNEEIDEHNH